MRIEYECSGGFANLNLILRVDTRSLSTQQAETIEALVDQARFFETTAQGATAPAAPPLPDGLHYHLSIDDGRRQHSLDMTDRTTPAGFRPLLQLLQKMAIEQKQTTD